MTGAPRVAAVGGGHGLSRALAALRRLDAWPTAVVTVADDGGSSGRLRRDLDVIAFGDLRMALVTLARNRPLADVLAHRFAHGELKGHALGNLVLLALAERAADPVAALLTASQLLECAGLVLPATATPVQLKARVGGRQVDGQVDVARTPGPAERVWLEPPDPPACDEAVEAILGADAVVLGPGSLFTSVIATLLVPGIADAVARTSATVVYVANVLTQPGETSGLDAQGHIDALHAHVPGLRLDAVILHDGPVPAGPGDGLGTAVPGTTAAVVRADVAARRSDGEVIGAHDPTRLSDALAHAIPARVGGGAEAAVE